MSVNSIVWVSGVNVVEEEVMEEVSAVSLGIGLLFVVAYSAYARFSAGLEEIVSRASDLRRDVEDIRPVILMSEPWLRQKAFEKRMADCELDRMIELEEARWSYQRQCMELYSRESDGKSKANADGCYLGCDKEWSTSSLLVLERGNNSHPSHDSH